jgi:hypothetical protein
MGEKKFSYFVWLVKGKVNEQGSPLTSLHFITKNMVTPITFLQRKQGGS